MINRNLCLFSLLCLLLSGCSHQTTVILPPAGSTEATVAKTLPATVSTAPTTESTDPSETDGTEASVPATTEILDPTPPEAMKKPDVYDISSHSIGALEYGILSELNTRRTAAGLSPVSLDSTLCALARIRGYECSITLSHNRPDGRSWQSVLSDYGRSGGAGESILYGVSGYTAAQIVETWMSTDSHKSILLDPNAVTAGIGIWYDNGKMYVVCLFTA